MRRQRQLLVEMDRMNGRRVKALSRGYRRDVIEPLVAAVEEARGSAEVLKKLGPGLLKKMDSAALETALAETEVQMGAIGRAAALPRRARQD